MSPFQILEEGNEEPEFWRHLGGKPSRIAAADSVMSDFEAEKTAVLDLYEIKELCGSRCLLFFRLSMFCLSDLFTANGVTDIQISCVDKNRRGNLEYRKLNSKSVYLLDCETWSHIILLCLCLSASYLLPLLPLSSL